MSTAAHIEQAEIAQRFQRFQRFKRFEKRREEAATAVFDMYLNDLRPNERFPPHTAEQIMEAWTTWTIEDEVFVRMTGHGTVKTRTFPKPPPPGPEYLPCRQMWACLIHQQVKEEDEQIIVYIREAVDKIQSSPTCKSHPPTCPCKVPNTPWTSGECVEALEPLGIRHSPHCECGGSQICMQKGKTEEQILWETEMKKGQQGYEAMMERSHAENRLEAMVRRAQDRSLRSRAELKLTAIAAVGSAKTPEAAVEKAAATLAMAEEGIKMCVCDASQSGQVACVCFPRRKAEMEMAKDNLKAIRLEAMAVAGGERAAAAAVRAAEMAVAGTEGAAAAAAAAAVRAAAAARAAAGGSTEKSPYDYKHNVDTCACGTCHKARMDSGTDKAYTARVTRAATMTDQQQDDFAKNIFAAMGTPHDSLCTHGRPFYSCMPCSH